MEIAVSTSPAHIMMTRRKNTWYSANDGNWSDPNTWLSNGLDKKSIVCPQVGDDVCILHNVNFDINAIVNNLTIQGKLSGGNGLTLTINGDLQANGSLDFTSSSIIISLNGYNNYVTFFTCGNSTIVYNGTLAQQVMGITYNNLTTQNFGYKYQNSDVTIDGNFNVQSPYEVGAHNLIVTGTSTIGTVGVSYIFSKNSSTGSILFIGTVDFEGVTNLSGNPNVEFRGGTTIHTLSLTTGTGAWTFSTNSQTIACNAYLGGTWGASIVVSGTITLTLSGGSALQVNNTINGTAAGSTFNNDGILYLGYNSNPMATGVFNYQHLSTSTLGYVFNGTFTLPYTSYANLVIAGTGVKTQIGNTTVNKAFTSNGAYECGGYDLNVIGAFNHHGGGNFTTSSFCNITIGGAASFTITSGTGYVDLRTGNANVELVSPHIMAVFVQRIS